MAIGTRDKRASALNPFLPFGRSLPTPDGSIGTPDRRQLAYGYRLIPRDLIGAETSIALPEYSTSLAVQNIDTTVAAPEYASSVALPSR